MQVSTSREEISGYFRNVQDEICDALETADGRGRFGEDSWDRGGGGGGRTRVMQDGAIIEKGGVNFSAVWGDMPQNVLKTLDTTHKSQITNLSDRQAGHYFYATGVSVVIHPVSPMLPIIHMNLRYFELHGNLRKSPLTNHHSPITNWFGGGIDLTPHYIDKEDAAFFHRTLKEVCDRFHPDYYPDFKKWADEYFYIKHREETRGVGGIFFDRLGEDLPPHQNLWCGGLGRAAVFDFVKAVAKTFVPIYKHLIDKNKNRAYGEKEVKWQLLRRGRYVEFNLIYDRGTKFGLETNGRTESILMSLPQKASWFYDHIPSENSPEQQTLELLKKGVNWAG